MRECIDRSGELKQMSKWYGDFGFLGMQEEEGGGDAPAAAAAGDSSEPAAKVREACMTWHCCRMTRTHFACSSHAFTGKSPKDERDAFLHAINTAIHSVAMTSIHAICLISISFGLTVQKSLTNNAFRFLTRLTRTAREARRRSPEHRRRRTEPLPPLPPTFSSPSLPCSRSRLLCPYLFTCSSPAGHDVVAIFDDNFR